MMLIFVDCEGHGPAPGFNDDPVDDAMGNLEAFERIERGER